MRDAPPNLPTPEANERLPAPRHVSSHLQRLILRGSLKPGDRLPSQRELAGQLGVSRPTVREALTALETMGLVTVKVGSGVFVAAPASRAPLWRFSDRCSPRDVYEARYGLESHAARLAAEHIDDDGVERLRRCVADMKAALDGDDIVAMAGADAAFHDLVFELSANPVLAGMYRPVREMMVETQRLPMTRRTRLDDTLREHERLLERLAARDGPGSEEAMKSHIRSAAQRFGLAI